MKKQVKVKLKDIAEHLDLSIPTVSRALGGFSDISQATRTLVENTAREMDYRPNPHAKSLVTKKASIDNILILGVPSVLKSISFNSYYAEIIRAFCDVIDTSKYRLVLSAEDNGENVESEFRDYHSLIENHSAVAAIILDLKENDKRVMVLNDAKIPFVVLGEYEPTSDIQYAVWTDNFKGAQLATTHLIHKGRKRIALLAGLHGQLVTSSREKGYRKALEEANLEFDKDLIVEPEDLGENGGYIAMFELFHRKIDFDAVFCASDLRLLGVIKALREKNLKIPKDISVVGYDDLTIASFYDPPLTTIRQPTYKVGVHAMKTLEKMLNGERPYNKKKILNPKLIIRTSA